MQGAFYIHWKMQAASQQKRTGGILGLGVPLRQWERFGVRLT